MRGFAFHTRTGFTGEKSVTSGDPTRREASRYLTGVIYSYTTIKRSKSLFPRPCWIHVDSTFDKKNVSLNDN